MKGAWREAYCGGLLDVPSRECLVEPLPLVPPRPPRFCNCVFPLKHTEQRGCKVKLRLLLRLFVPRRFLRLLVQPRVVEVCEEPRERGVWRDAACRHAGPSHIQTHRRRHTHTTTHHPKDQVGGISGGESGQWRVGREVLARLSFCSPAMPSPWMLPCSPGRHNTRDDAW